MDLKYSALSTIPKNHPELTNFKQTSDSLDFENINPLVRAVIVPRESKLKVEFRHQQPALQGEWYEIQVDILNEELFDIDNLKIEVGLEEESSEG